MAGVRAEDGKWRSPSLIVIASKLLIKRNNLLRSHLIYLY